MNNVPYLWYSALQPMIWTLDRVQMVLQNENILFK